MIRTLLAALAIVAFLAAAVSQADTDVTLHWEAPTQCTNNESFGEGTCSVLTRFALRCGPKNGPYEHLWGIDALDENGAVKVSHTESYADGEYYCSLYARNDAGFSAPSNEIHFTVTTAPPEPSVPGPVTNITIEVSP